GDKEEDGFGAHEPGPHPPGGERQARVGREVRPAVEHGAALRGLPGAARNPPIRDVGHERETEAAHERARRARPREREQHRREGETERAERIREAPHPTRRLRPSPNMTSAIAGCATSVRAASPAATAAGGTQTRHMHASTPSRLSTWSTSQKSAPRAPASRSPGCTRSRRFTKLF